MDKGVTCTQCGASTPMPSDLRVPTFECAYCHATLRTADYAGEASVAASQLNAFVRSAVTEGNVDGPAPAYKQRSQEVHSANCLRCGAPLSVTMDLHVHTVTCPACRVEQPISAYVSEKDRFMRDMARQVEENEALKRLHAQGVACHKCGGMNKVPADGTVQIPCAFCDAVILLSDFVSPEAVARSQLRKGMADMRAHMADAQEKQRKRGIVISVVILAVVAIAIAVTFAVQQMQ